MKIWGAHGWPEIRKHSGLPLSHYSRKEENPRIHRINEFQGPSEYTPFVRASVHESVGTRILHSPSTVASEPGRPCLAATKLPKRAARSASAELGSCNTHESATPYRLEDAVHNERPGRQRDAEQSGKVALIAGTGGSIALAQISDSSQLTPLAALPNLAEPGSARTLLPLGDIRPLVDANAIQNDLFLALAFTKGATTGKSSKRLGEISLGRTYEERQ